MRRATELRPLTLIQTSTKVIATIANQELTTIADKVVVGNQRGFIPQRVMSDNIIQLEGTAFAYSQLWGVTPAGILLDFAQAFPSLAHQWMWAAINALGVCTEFHSLLHVLYFELITTVFFDNSELNTIKIAAGIKQGCPLSGTLFAIAVDPLVRAHLDITLHYATICLFADDVALVLRCLRTPLGPLLVQMTAWHTASGLGLKHPKCVIIMLYGDEETYKNIVDQHPEAAGMRIARAATYLGIEVGPEGHNQQ